MIFSSSFLCTRAARAVLAAGILAAVPLALTTSMAFAASTTKNAAAESSEKNVAPMQNGGSWADIKDDITKGATLLDGANSFSVNIPVRAEDAALVPIRLIGKSDAPIDKASIIIDENPAPVAGQFTFGKAMQPVDFETRIRVNQYSNVRIIADIAGKSYMDGHFVKASGGCSAPATKSAELATADMGKMKLKEFVPQSAIKQSMPRRSAQLMIRHPNYSGLQRDQVTQLFVPAKFINNLEVYQGKDLLFAMEGGISISENPTFRFDYNDNGERLITVRATDTDGNKFDVELEKNALN